MVAPTVKEVTSPVAGNAQRAGGVDWNQLVTIIKGTHATERIPGGAIEDQSITALQIGPDEVGDSEVVAHTSTKITITAKGQLNAQLVYDDQANTFGDFDQTFKDNRILIESPDGLTPITIINAQQTLARNLTIPILTGNRNILVSGEGNIVNADVNAAAAIVYTKLDLSNSIVNGDLAGGVYAAITGLGAQSQDLDMGNQDIINAVISDFSNLVLADGTHLQIRNESGGAYVKGDVVHISGFSIGQGLALTVKADASAAATMPTIGIVNEAIANNASGQICITGIMDTLNTAAFSEGDVLYVSETAGAFTNVKPTGTALIQNIATVLRSHASLGEIQIISINRSNDLPNIANANLWVGNASGVPTAVVISGDATMINTGALTIANNAINDAKITAHTSTKITITAKGQLNAQIVFNDQANTYTGGGAQAFGGANLTGVGTLQFDDVNTSIQQTTADLQIDVATGGAHLLRINNVAEYTFNVTQADFNGNSLIDVGTLQFADVNTSIQQSADDLQYDVAAAGFHLFRFNNVTSYTFTAGALGMNQKVLSNVGQIDFGDANTTIEKTTLDLQIDVASSGAIVLRVNNVTEYDFDATQADFNGNNIIDLGDVTFADASNIIINATTGTKIGTGTTQKIGFWNATPVVQPTALTTQLTQITFVDENTPDFALASLKLHSDDTGAGFADLDEAQAFVEVVANLQTRVAELETKLQAVGILA